MIAIFMDQQVCPDYAVIWDGKERYTVCQLWPAGADNYLTNEIAVDAGKPVTEESGVSTQGVYEAQVYALALLQRFEEEGT